jgi:hypothetical protein
MGHKGGLTKAPPSTRSQLEEAADAAFAGAKPYYQNLEIPGFVVWVA